MSFFCLPKISSEKTEFVCILRVEDKNTFLCVCFFFFVAEKRVIAENRLKMYSK